MNNQEAIKAMHNLNMVLSITPSEREAVNMAIAALEEQQSRRWGWAPTAEKILEEIEEATIQEDAPIYCGNMEVDGYVRMSVVKGIIRKYIDGWIPIEEALPKPYRPEDTE